MSAPGGAAARGYLSTGDTPVDIPRVPAREAAETELSRPMYHENDPNLLQRGLDALLSWLGDLFDSAAGAAPHGPLGAALLTAVVLGIAGVLWWRLGAPRRVSGTRTDLLFGANALRSADEHRAAAEAHAAARRWTEAVQERMRALVRSLEERTLLEPRPGRTADEAAAEAGRTLPEHATALRTAARAFDDVTYGGHDADQNAYLGLRTLDLTLRDARPHLPAARALAPNLPNPPGPASGDRA
ncbi:DUF4129 domain-containing protein [uncultured Streptomyces sp.]|uniref:DUF4129 domain-containing protein n=1 Tax=uncultured Streptomyces sp. TaxID=174707 RepID=UPI00260D492E|nr:DUF4129 domain-containing protein [uncultured Streptomyces sp.]